jgi:hypothetical protein
MLLKFLAQLVGAVLVACTLLLVVAATACGRMPF